MSGEMVIPPRFEAKEVFVRETESGVETAWRVFDRLENAYVSKPWPRGFVEALVRQRNSFCRRGE